MGNECSFSQHSRREISCPPAKLDSPIHTVRLSPEYEMDDAFTNHFRSLHQVFMYITDQCNLRCKQCLYKPTISQYPNLEIGLIDALALLRSFRRLGASKVTFLGGEPTLYGRRQLGSPLFDLIEGTKKIGYEYIRLDTNGLNTPNFMKHPTFSRLSELAFSLDGPTPKINDSLRGKGTFKKTLDSINLAVGLGYFVTITCCIHNGLLKRGNDGILLIEKMINFAQDLGAQIINFHDLFKVGVPMDSWTGSFAPSVEEWLPVYKLLSEKIDHKQFSIPVRLPRCFVEKSEFIRNAKYYGYCPAKLGERIMVHPNGVIRICSNLICTAFGVAHYHQRKIVWDYSINNELSGHDGTQYTRCTNRSRNRTYSNLVPLCFSFKPGQKEYVWQHELKWEQRRR